MARNTIPGNTINTEITQNPDTENLINNFKPGQSSDAAFRVQVALSNLGLYQDEINGIVTPGTLLALKEFERRYDIEDEEILSRRTADLLTRTLGINSDTYDIDGISREELRNIVGDIRYRIFFVSPNGDISSEESFDIAKAMLYPHASKFAEEIKNLRKDLVAKLDEITRLARELDQTLDQDRDAESFRLMADLCDAIDFDTSRIEQFIKEMEVFNMNNIVSKSLRTSAYAAKEDLRFEEGFIRLHREKQDDYEELQLLTEKLNHLKTIMLSKLNKIKRTISTLVKSIVHARNPRAAILTDISTYYSLILESFDQTILTEIETLMSRFFPASNQDKPELEGN